MQSIWWQVPHRPTGLPRILQHPQAIPPGALGMEPVLAYQAVRDGLGLSCCILSRTPVHQSPHGAGGGIQSPVNNYGAQARVAEHRGRLDRLASARECAHVQSDHAPRAGPLSLSQGRGRSLLGSLHRSLFPSGDLLLVFLVARYTILH